MTAKQTKIRQLTKTNIRLEQELLVAKRKIEVLLSEGDTRMFDIDNIVDQIENRFSQLITWNELTPDPDVQLKFLKRKLNHIHEIARHNQDDETKIQNPKIARILFSR